MYKLKMKENNTSGLLITFCGLDGCGKTTMIKKVFEELSGEYQMFLTRQPTTAVRESKIFRTYMDSPEHDAYDYRSLSLLAASDRIQHVNKVILPAIGQGRLVISDRYFYSCLANLHARGYRNDKWIFEIAQSIIKPDIAFFLDVPVQKAIERVRRRPDEKERYIDVELQYLLHDEYKKICKANDGILISTAQSEEDTYKQIINEIRKVLEDKYDY